MKSNNETTRQQTHVLPLARHTGSLQWKLPAAFGLAVMLLGLAGCNPAEPDSKLPRFRAQVSGAPAAAGEPQAEKKKPSLVDLLLTPEERKAMEAQAARRNRKVDPNLPDIDDATLQAFGIRKITSKHLIFYTDVLQANKRPDPFVEEIPRLFDRAVVEWAKYFEVPEEDYKDWVIAGSLMQDKKKFQQAKLLPDDLPEFLNGYHRGRQFWVHEQDSHYYRRHLVFHEGVHGFMYDKLGGGGPPWYREGVAELLATHQWKNRQLRVGYMPYNKEEVPYWGRIKALKNEYRNGRPLMLRQVMEFDEKAHLQVESYAWCWAATAFLDGHLSYQKPFRELRKNVKDETPFFSRGFEAALRAQARELDEEWQLFIANVDYGYDFRRNAVRYQFGTPLRDGQRTIAINTNLGWQSTGIRMEEGKEYLIAAKGKFTVQRAPKKWECEPGGITIEYANGMPLGMLLGNIRRDEPLPGAAGLVRPIRIGLSRRVRAAGNGTLYLRVNEKAGGLADNQGQITVKVVDTAEVKATEEMAGEKSLVK